MTIIAILLFLILLFITRQTHIDASSKKMLNMFVIYWFISIILASLRVYDIFKVSIYTYALVFIGVFSFSFGFLIVAKKRNNCLEITKEDISSQVIRLSGNIFYRIMMVLASIYIYSLLVIFFNKILLYGSLASVRTEFYAAELYGPLFGQINAFFLRPLYLITLPVFAYLLLYKRNWFCLLLGFYLFGYESLGGGRIGYVRIIVGIIFVAYCLLNTFKNKKRFGYTIIIIGAVLIFGLLSIVSAARQGEVGLDSSTRRSGAETTSKHIISYTACPIVAFDHSIEYDYKGLLGGYQYGNLTFTPVLGSVNLFSSRFGMTIPLKLNELIEYKQNIPIDISPDMDWNALYTANLYYYLDFGLFGIILFPFLFGLLISGLITKLYKYKSLPLVMIVSYCLWCMLDSVLDNAFHSPYDFLFLMILYFLGTRNIYLRRQ